MRIDNYQRCPVHHRQRCVPALELRQFNDRYSGALNDFPGFALEEFQVGVGRHILGLRVAEFLHLGVDFFAVGGGGFQARSACPVGRRLTLIER